VVAIAGEGDGQPTTGIAAVAKARAVH
jgi:hypothetical protein